LQAQLIQRRADELVVRTEARCAVAIEEVRRATRDVQRGTL
jgi:hypothetical protein